jgi:hypothetical protein
MLYVCEMRVGVSISATTSVKRTSYGHLITQPQLPFGQRRPWDDRRIRSSFCFTPRRSSEEILAQHRAQLVMSYGRPHNANLGQLCLDQTTIAKDTVVLTNEIPAANPIDEKRFALRDIVSCTCRR